MRIAIFVLLIVGATLLTKLINFLGVFSILNIFINGNMAYYIPYIHKHTLMYVEFVVSGVLYEQHENGISHRKKHNVQHFQVFIPSFLEINFNTLYIRNYQHLDLGAYS